MANKKRNKYTLDHHNLIPDFLIFPLVYIKYKKKIFQTKPNIYSKVRQHNTKHRKINTFAIYTPPGTFQLYEKIIKMFVGIPLVYMVKI